MIYQSRGKNSTGQVVVTCPHVPVYVLPDMWVLPDGSGIYRIYSMMPVWLKASKQTIVLWCDDCYSGMEKMESATLKESCSQ